VHLIHKGTTIFLRQTCYSCSKRHCCRWRVRDNQFVIVFNLNSASCMSMCLFVGAIADKVALFSTFEASASLSVLLAFFVICGFVDNGRCIYCVIILGRKTWLRGLCAISWSVPILIVRSWVVASRAMPDLSQVLPLSLSLSLTGIEGPIFRMKQLHL